MYSLAERDHRATASQPKVSWLREWTTEADAALRALPAELYTDPEILRTIWDYGVGRRRQRFGIVRTETGSVVGVLLLKQAGIRWRPLTEDLLPASRFAVLPEFIDCTLASLRCYLWSDYSIFYRPPAASPRLSIQSSAVVDLREPYVELMRRKNYNRRDRQCRAKTADMTIIEDRWEDLPSALDTWAAAWTARGFQSSARQRDERLLVLELLARRGQLKTFSLWDGDVLAAHIANVVDGDVLHLQVTTTRPEYRDRYAGIRMCLATLDWAYANGLREYDLGPTHLGYKMLWGELVERTYVLSVGPFGSQPLAELAARADALRWRLLYRMGRRS